VGSGDLMQNIYRFVDEPEIYSNLFVEVRTWFMIGSETLSSPWLADVGDWLDIDCVVSWY